MCVVCVRVTHKLPTCDPATKKTNLFSARTRCDFRLPAARNRAGCPPLGNISLREALLEMRAMATPKPAPFPWHVMCVSIVASLNNMAFGYDVGVISGAWRPPAQVLFGVFGSSPTSHTKRRWRMVQPCGACACRSQHSRPLACRISHRHGGFARALDVCAGADHVRAELRLGVGCSRRRGHLHGRLWPARHAAGVVAALACGCRRVHLPTCPRTAPHRFGTNASGHLRACFGFALPVTPSLAPPRLAGGSAVTLAQSFFVLLLGRALQGLGSGCAWCACAVYIAEMAPKEWRGGLVAISDISINVGILLGFAVDRAIILALPREPDLRWRVAMGVSLILPLFYVVAHPFLPESPRWLLMSGRKTEADRVLAWLEGSAKGRERDGPNVVSPDLEVNVPYDPTAAGHPSAARLPAARAGTRTAAYEVDASDGDGGNGHPPMNGRTVPVAREIVGQDTSWVAGGDGGDRCTDSGSEPRLGSPRPRSSSGQKALSWRDSLCPPTRYEKRQVRRSSLPPHCPNGPSRRPERRGPQTNGHTPAAGPPVLFSQTSCLPPQALPAFSCGCLGGRIVRRPHCHSDLLTLPAPYCPRAVHPCPPPLTAVPPPPSAHCAGGHRHRLGPRAAADRHRSHPVLHAAHSQPVRGAFGASRCPRQPRGGCQLRVHQRGLPRLAGRRILQAAWRVCGGGGAWAVAA